LAKPRFGLIRVVMANGTVKMAWGRRVTSALAVFGVGTIAALPFYHPPSPVESSAVKAPVAHVSESPPSVALQIPANEMEATATEPDAKTIAPSSTSRAPGPVAKQSSLERDIEPPIISNEFPSSNQHVPQTSSNPIKINPRPNQPRSAADSESHGDGPRVHRIRDGDTLRRLAERYLKNGDRWIEILDANRSVLRDPDVLPVGKVITIPERGNRETTTVNAAVDTPPSVNPKDEPLTPLVPIR
jgi:nucleoid-associated protein YgaU